MRQRLFEIVEVSDGNSRLSRAYDLFMMAAIVASVIPLMFKGTSRLLSLIDAVCAGVFIVDYLLRLITADYRLDRGKVKSFFLYPFTPMAIVDLLAILPTFTPVASGLRVLKVFRLMRICRIFKFFRYSKSIDTIARVIERQKEPLLTVYALAVVYIFISALIVFDVEPDTFENFFGAIYWAMEALTTVGYGDIYPVSTAGRIISMISSFVGIAIVALPSGIITAGYMEEIGRHDSDEQD